MNNGVLQSSSLVQPAMAIPGNPNWRWNVNGIPSSPPALQLLPSPPTSFGGSIPSNLCPAPTSSSNSSSSSSWQEMDSHNPESWSQLLLGGLVVDDHRSSDDIMHHFQAQQSQNNAFFTDHIKQENLTGRYISIYGHANDYDGSFQLGSAASQSAWSPMAHVILSNISGTTSTETNSVPHYSKKDRGTRRPTRDQVLECNSNANGGAQKKARVQPSSPQSTFKVRKEKLGDRITALHQIVSPYGKTDTASVLLEAYGYIRFLQNQIEALSLPYLGRDDSEEEGMKRMGLRNRGLCLVPIPCTLGVGYENNNMGADHWAAANSFEALHKWNVGGIFMALLTLLPGMNGSMAYGFLTKEVTRLIDRINDEGPFLGIVIPNAFEMSPLLKSPSFVPDQKLPYLDLYGKRFRFGQVEGKNVILVITGLSMVNAGITTQLLLTLFKINGVLHHGIAGNANPNFEIGDVTIPRYWAHTGLWVWQRYGDGADDALPYESGGDFTRRIGVLNISENNVGTDKSNFLNNIWLQDEEIFPVNGFPEQRQRAFWVPVDKHYYKISEKLKDMKLENCVNTTTCLPRKPVVARVERGVTASVYVDNKAYRQFLYSELKATPVDMETAAVALICYQQRTPFIAIRSLSDLAGGGSALWNEASIFSGLAAQNAVDVLVKFIELLES